MDNKQTINSVIYREFDIQESLINRETSIVGDLNADSLDSVELVMALEESFGQDIPDDACEQWQTVGDIYDYFDGDM